MWGKLGVSMTGIVDAAIHNVQSVVQNVEAQLDAAVGQEELNNKVVSEPAIYSNSSIDEISKDAFISKTLDTTDIDRDIEDNSPLPTQTTASIISHQNENISTLLNGDESVINMVDPIGNISKSEQTRKKTKKKSNNLTNKSQTYIADSARNLGTKTTETVMELQSTDINEVSNCVENIVMNKNDDGNSVRNINEIDSSSGDNLNEPNIATTKDSVASSTLSNISNFYSKRDCNINPQEESGTSDKIICKLEETTSSSDQILILKYESSISEYKKSLENLENISSQDKNTIRNLEEQIFELRTQVDSLNQDSLSTKSLQNNNESLRLTVEQMKIDMEKHANMLHDKSVELSQLYIKYEESKKIHDELHSQLLDAKNMLKQYQSNSSIELEQRKEIMKYQELNRIQEERLQSFESEGAILAKKQSEMEKTVRKLRQDIREKDAEIAKFKESKEQQDKLISSLEDSIKKKDLDLSNSQKNTIAIQAVSAASAEKILRLEAEIVDKTNEFAGQRRALENSYAECNELKKVLADLRCEKEELQRELGQGATRVVETESTRRDLEHREAILRATNKQLQDSLQRQMAEAVGREERMREELLDTRKRWQDAVTTREALASEMAVATTPLLRQISSLQESIRIKGDNWQKIESTLSERALRAEHLADAAENRKLFLEDQNASLKQQLNAQNSTIEELRIANDALTVSIDKLNTEISSNQKMILNLQDTYAKECTAKKEMEERLNNLDTHCKKAILEANDAASIISKRCDSQIHSLQSTIDSLTRELEIEKSKRGKEDSSLPQYNTRKIEFVSRDTRYENNVTDSSYAASERINQQLMQKEEEAESLNFQLQQIQRSRDSLLEEVSYLSSRSIELEEKLASLPSLQQSLTTLRDKNNALLLLLGEKEEEVEAITSDLQEVKYLYRTEIDSLLNKLLALNSTST